MLDTHITPQERCGSDQPAARKAPERCEQAIRMVGEVPFVLDKAVVASRHTHFWSCG